MTSLNPVMKVGQADHRVAPLPPRHRAGTPPSWPRPCSRRSGSPSPSAGSSEYPHQLSGGMRQRVMIAIALACGPKLLFADEPTTALDVTVQAQILDLLQEQQRERFMAMILVTHDLGVVAGRTDEIAVMYAGQDRREGADAGAVPQHEDAVHRGARALDPEAVRQPSHTRLNAIPGRPPQLVNPPIGCRFAPRCPYAQEKCVKEEPPLRDERRAGAQVPRAGSRSGRLRAEKPSNATAPPACRRRSAATARQPLRRTRTRRRTADMAGSGTAHLRPADDTLLRAEHLVVEFPVGRIGTEGPRRLRREPRHRRGRDARARRRVGMRQVDDRPGHDPAAAADLRHRRVRGPGPHQAQG